MELLTISGSLRTGSVNSRLLTHTEDLALAAGHRVFRFDRVAELPPFNEDHEQWPNRAVADLHTDVRRADALLIATPEYSGSIPGQLKNLLDWAARPAGESDLAGLPAAVISASPSQFGAAWARETTEHILTQIGAKVLPTGWGLSLADEWAADHTGRLEDGAEDQLRTIIERLAAPSSAPQHGAVPAGA